MAATPGEGEMAKRGKRQDVARALSTTDGRLARSPLSHELSRRCCLCGDRERYIYTTELKQASEQAKEPSPCLYPCLFFKISGNPRKLRNQRLLIEIGLVFA